MAASNMDVSTIDYHCTLGDYSVKSNAQTSEQERHSTSGRVPSFELKHSESLKPELKPQWLQSKDASKRKRVNRTAKLKQCKLDARREQWLSQGSHGGVKHVDLRCHDILAHKGNDGRSVDLLREQGSPSDSHCQGSTERPKFRPGVHPAEDEGRRSSTSTAVRVHGEQAMPSSWEHLNQHLLPELNHIKNKCIDKSFRSTLFHHNGNDVLDIHSMAMMHEICLTERRDTSLFNMLLGPVAQPSEASMTTTKNQTEIILGEPDLCRLKAFIRDGQETSVSNVQKQERGSDNFSCSHSDVSISHLPVSTNNSTVSGYAGSSSNDNGCGEDDWEVVADAIYMLCPSSKAKDLHKVALIDKGDLLEQKGKLSDGTEVQTGTFKPEYKYKADGLGGRTRSMSGGAWRSDDAARPPMLPRLSKQHSFPLISTPPVWNKIQDNSLWGPPPSPLFCPICTEELDVTDCSFMPCSCGFRLCLFCHHRIASDDGRCPGCRKTYNSDVAMKLSCTPSVWLQV